MKVLLFFFGMLPACLFATPPGGKYAIGLFHFNFQYVAGDYKIERRIVRESLFPVLQFFDKHPEYRSDIEMQGYGIEVLATEHPDVLALLKKLVRRGQIELVVAHYSDQLFIGYPAEDLRRSVALSDSILVRHGLQRSGVFFGQEFQWSPALASALKGKYDVVVTSSDPNSWYEGGGAPLVNVVYGQDTIMGLIGGGNKDLPGLSWRIAFLDDGEEFNTKDYNSDFHPVPAQEQENIDKYKKLLAEGYRFVTVSELVRQIRKDTAYRTPVYPLVPEGTWHMKVCGPFMWMGRQRSGVETDGITRAVSYRLRGEVMMTEALVAYAAGQGKDVSVLREWLKQAWEHLLLSEVSDSSGWDPWLVEVQYTDNEAATAWKLIAQIMEQLRKLLSVPNGGWTVDTKSGAVATGGPAMAAAGVPAALPVDCSVLAGRYSASVQKLGDSLYQMDIECTRPADGAVEISFGTAAEGLRYSPSCGEDRSVVIPTGYPHDPAFALANGFIYLNNGYSLVKDCGVEHLAATWKVKERRLVFREELREGNNTMHMRFFLVKGMAERGLEFANALNTWPVYKLDSNWVWSRRLPDLGHAQQPDAVVRWSFGGNNYAPPPPKAAAVLTVASKGAGLLPASGWKIYFNSSRSVDTASEQGELRIRHINGDLFCLEPLGKPGHELQVRFICSDLSMNVSDAPTGFFWVWDGAPGPGYPLTDSIVGRIDDEKLRLVTPALEYTNNARIKDIPEGQLSPVFPTPVSCRVMPGRLRLDADLVITTDTAFRREADYLAEELAPVLGRRPRVVDHSATPGLLAMPGLRTTSRRVAIVLERGGEDSSGYTLHTGTDGVRIAAVSAEGLFNGVQTLLEAIGPGATLPVLDVRDRPRFAYRGLMIDVARNFRGPRELKRILDLMALCKLNVLHLHLTDDEGWRLDIPGMPELVSSGGRRGWPAVGMLPPSFGSGPAAAGGYYSREEFIELLRYARDRHIRVIPEIECPGHARAAIQAMDARYATLSRAGSPGAAEYLLRDTLDRSVYEGAQLWHDNVVCPALPSVYRFMDKVVRGVEAMYRVAGAPLSTVHFGGDEVPAGAWEGSPECKALATGVAGGELRRYCWSYFYSRLDSLLMRHGLALSGWEEAALPGKDFNIYVWDNMIGGGNEDLPYRLANAGHKVVLACVSNNYYDLAYEPVFEEPGYHWAGFLGMEKPFSFIPLDYYRNSTEDWQGDPVRPGYFDGKEKLTKKGQQNILGIEGLLWGENLISDERAEYMLLPKLLGTAERAWAPDPAWATVAAGAPAIAASYDSAWVVFLNTCGKRLLPRLSRLNGGYAYRIPPPGVVVHDERIWANGALPGLTIRYTTDGSEPTTGSSLYTGPLVYKIGISLRAFDETGRGGRSVTIKNQHI